MNSWKTTSLCPGFRPRQFEYSPHIPELLVFGTLRGEVCVVDHRKNHIVAADLGVTQKADDSILGLCWLNRTDHNLFVTGSSKGVLKLCEVWSSGESSHSIRSSAYKTFRDLTSVHVNCSDDRLLVSGYTKSVGVYDLESKQIVRTYENVHDDHINISRFTNLSPHIFGTSSFDKTVKVWDLRDSNSKPIYTCQSSNGHVMLCFSPDDLYVLTSAVDNEVRQYLTVDGRLQAHLEMPQTGRLDNYTRAYYMNEGDRIISGSSEEQTVRIHCAHTGALLHSSQMYSNRQHESLYVQSLRGDPHQRDSFSVLVNYRDVAHPLEIIKVDMNYNQKNEDISEIMRCSVSPAFTTDIQSIQQDQDSSTCDVLLVPSFTGSSGSSSSTLIESKNGTQLAFRNNNNNNR